MPRLNQERCVACRRDSPSVTEQEILEFQPLIPEWTLKVEDGVKKLERQFKFGDFPQAVAFTTVVADAAEEEAHHPKITTEWGKVTVEWWTHKIRNLHRNDFIMAVKTDIMFGDFAKLHPMESAIGQGHRRVGEP